jgi:hypothetical protein
VLRGILIKRTMICVIRIATYVAKPNAQAFIIEPNMTITIISIIKRPKESWNMFKGEFVPSFSTFLSNK